MKGYCSNLFKRKSFCCYLAEDVELWKIKHLMLFLLFHSMLFPCYTKLFDVETFDGNTDDLHMADGMTNMLSSLPESYPPRPRSMLWPVMFLISHVVIQTSLMLALSFFLQNGLLFFHFCIIHLCRVIFDSK